MEKNKTLVSIIMPAFNCERYIRFAIDSVLNQEYKDWELIIIDDGSSDLTREIVKEIAKSGAKIKTIFNDRNLGVAKARNIGIGEAKGDWIAFLDCDDIWRADKLKKQLGLAQEKNAEFVFSGASYIDRDDKAFPGILQVPEIVDYKRLRKHNIIPCSSVLVKKKYSDQVKMQDGDLHEDFVAWLKLLETGLIAHGVAEPLITYRISKESRSGKKIHTLKKTFAAFRATGMSIFKSSWFTLSHLVLALKKYKGICYKR